MVKISKFFGRDKGGEDEQCPPKKISIRPDVPIEPEEPAEEAAPKKNISRTHRPETAESVYDRMMHTFRKYRAGLAANPGTVDPLLYDIIDNFIEYTTDDEKSLFFLTEKTSLDTFVHSHSVNTAIIAITLGKGIGYPASALEKLGIAALLHHLARDVEPKNAELKEKEITAIRENTDASLNIIRKRCSNEKALETFIKKIAALQVTRGTTRVYPEKLDGSMASQFTQIILMAGVYELLTHAGPDKERIIPHEACKWLIENWQKIVNTPFTGQLIRSLINTIGLFPLGSYVRMSTGEIGRVIHVEKGSPVRPVIDVLLGSNGDRISDRKCLSLRDMPLINVEEAIDESHLKIKDKRFMLSLKVRRWWTGNRDK